MKNNSKNFPKQSESSEDGKFSVYGELVPVYTKCFPVYSDAFKTCLKCGEEKFLNEFSKHKGFKDGRRSQCKTCEKQYYETRKARIAAKSGELYKDMEIRTKVCSKCNVEKPLTEFSKKSSNSDGFYCHCKECKSETDKEYRGNNAEEISVRRKKFYINNKDRLVNSEKIYLESKECVKCGIVKDRSEFTEDRIKTDGLSSYCKSCKKKFDKKYSKENFERRAKLQAIYNRKNRERLREKSAEWARKNKDIIRIKKRNYVRFRLNTDINFKLALYARSRLRVAIKKNQKSGSAVRDLGCTVEYFKSYIEDRFYLHSETGEEMTWENWGRGKGKWNLHHIILLSEFDLTDRGQFLKAVHYTNQEPLWHEDHWERHRSERNKNRHGGITDHEEEVFLENVD